MKQFALYLATLFTLLACNSNKHADSIPLEAPEELKSLRLQMGQELTHLFHEDSVRWDTVMALIDSAQSTFWYDPQFYIAESYVQYMQGNKAESDSLLLHSRNLYDQRLRQRQDFNDAVNRAALTAFLYGREAFYQELDSLATIKAYKPDTLILQSLHDAFEEFDPKLSNLF